MPIRQTRDVDGYFFLERNFENLTRGAQRSLLRGAGRAAAKVLQTAIRANAPVGKGTRQPGLLKRSIIVRVGRKNIPGAFNIRVGVKRTFSANPPDAFYAHMVEFGTVHSKANPFMRNALDANAGRAIEAARRALVPAFNKLIEKPPRRRGRRF